jgi:hypothetical protein
MLVPLGRFTLVATAGCVDLPAPVTRTSGRHEQPW